MNRYSFVVETKVSDEGVSYIARREDRACVGTVHNFPLGIANCPILAIIELCKRLLENVEEEKIEEKPSDHDHRDQM